MRFTLLRPQYSTSQKRNRQTVVILYDGGLSVLSVSMGYTGDITKRGGFMNDETELEARVRRAFARRGGDDTQRQRMEQELLWFKGKDLQSCFLLTQMLSGVCRAHGRRYATALDGSYCAYLLGMTRFDPLEYELEQLPKVPFWIRVGDQFREPLRQSLAQFVQGNMLESERWRGTAYILYPQDGGTEFRIRPSQLYDWMDEFQPPADHFTPTMDWRYPGHIPGVFSEAEEYELRHCEAHSLPELVQVIQRMQNLPLSQALYLAADYLEAAELLARHPAKWITSFLNADYYIDAFDWPTMGPGLEVCRRALQAHREQQLGGINNAERVTQVYLACETAYQRGVAFLPPDPERSHRTKFLPISDQEILCPLGKAALRRVLQNGGFYAEIL
jgi:hypothetical protein